MPGVSFYLKTPKSNRSKIYISIHLYSRYQKPTNLSVKPKDWNQRKNRTKNNSIINKELDAIEERVWNLINGGNSFEANIDLAIRPPLAKSDQFSEMAEVFLTEYRVSASTRKQYEATFKIISDNWPNLNTDELDRRWHNQLIDLLIEKNYQKNTAGARIKNLMTVMKWADEEGHKVDPNYKKWTVFKSEKDIVFLTNKELNHLEHFPLLGLLDKSRDIHVLQSHLGQRYSDYLTIKPASVINQEKVEVFSPKTKKKVTVPLSDTAKRILGKYDWVPPRINHDKQLVYIKEACKNAGINQDITISKHYLDRVEQVTKPKYTEIGTHTARRTFVTLSFEKGIPADIIMSITGQTTYKMVMRYYKIVDERKFEAMQKWNAG